MKYLFVQHSILLSKCKSIGWIVAPFRPPLFRFKVKLGLVMCLTHTQENTVQIASNIWHRNAGKIVYYHIIFNLPETYFEE